MFLLLEKKNTFLKNLFMHEIDEKNGCMKTMKNIGRRY